MEELKEGDVVRLTTKEGPKMTINKINKEEIQCLWFDGPHLYSDWFNKKSVIKVGEN